MSADASGDMEKLLDLAFASGALASGQKSEDVLHQIGGDAATLALAAQQVEEVKGRASARKWTPEEDRFLDEALGQLSIDEISAYLGRSLQAIKIRRTRLGLDAPSKQAGELTARQTADLLGVDVHAVCRWIEDGILPGRVLPMERHIRVVKKATLWRWAVNPMNWPYFENSVYDDTRSNNGQDFAKGTDRIADPRLRRLIELKKKRWGDEWWSLGQVAEHHGVTLSGVHKAVYEGRIPGVRYQNWRVRKSDALKLQIVPGKGHGSLLDWSRRADEFLVLASAVGLPDSVIAALAGGIYSDKTVRYRLKSLMDGGIERVLQRAGSVQYDPGRGLLWTDWRQHTHRFPGLVRAIAAFKAGRELPHVERQYVRGVMTAWLRWFSEGDPDREELARRMTFGWQVRSERMWSRYRRMVEWGIDPFGIADGRREEATGHYG